MAGAGMVKVISLLLLCGSSSTFSFGYRLIFACGSCICGVVRWIPSVFSFDGFPVWDGHFAFRARVYEESGAVPVGERKVLRAIFTRVALSGIRGVFVLQWGLWDGNGCVCFTFFCICGWSD